jgi:hypothetical protein
VEAHPRREPVRADPGNAKIVFCKPLYFLVDCDYDTTIVTAASRFTACMAGWRQFSPRLLDNPILGIGGIVCASLPY